MNLTFQSKQELKEGYNMKGASPIGKEWFEQAGAFEAYAVGKTAAELAALPAGGHTTEPAADLAATCTMDIAAFTDAISRAAA